jgi:Zn-dependent peptidase ImmA (M78 family)
LEEVRTMALRVDVKPQLLEWARLRSGIDVELWASRFPKYDAWLAGDVQPTLKQLESFAAKTYTPFGYLLLDHSPVEEIPIPDFRTVRSAAVVQPSADLLDTIYLCEQRQEWYRQHLVSNGENPLPFVGTVNVATPIDAAAHQISEALDWTADRRRRARTWSDALAELRDRAESAGVLVMINGVVGANTHRKLKPEEFRGFALADSFAPVVFINGADSKAAQVFTLAHEIAHIWLGESGVSDLSMNVRGTDVERWCNAVAAELLVPMAEFEQAFDGHGVRAGELDRLAELFRVSTLVILGRIRDLTHMSWDRFRVEFDRELARIRGIVTERSGSGGNFYTTTPVRASKRFTAAVIMSALEGHTLLRDAFRLVGVSNRSAFDQLGERLGVA